MLKRILRLLFGTRPVRVPFDDPQIGKLVFGELGWAGKVDLDGDVVEFTLGGGDVPNARCLAHAHDIISDWTAFKRTIREFIEHETRNYPEEMNPYVSAIRIDTITLRNKDKPDSGMIFFRGHTEDTGVWKCDYVDRKPRYLSYDS